MSTFSSRFDWMVSLHMYAPRALPTHSYTSNDIEAAKVLETCCGDPAVPHFGTVDRWFSRLAELAQGGHSLYSAALFARLERLGCTVEGGTLKRPESSSSALSVEYFEARRLQSEQAAQ